MENFIKLIGIFLILILIYGVAIVLVTAILSIPINHFVEYENRGLANYIAFVSATIIVLYKLKTTIKK